MRPLSSSAICLAALLLGSGSFLQGQAVAQTDPMHREWHAGWISHPTAPLKEPIVLHFRHTLTLAAVPASYVVRVSADNRFILFVNGQRVGEGPARGDLTHWRYERFDLAPLLKAGENVITSTVWNFGVFAPVAQMTDRTAFLLESEAEGEQSISTPKGWMVEPEAGQGALPRGAGGLDEYMASGPGEEFDAARYDWNWNSKEAGAGWVVAGTAIRESIFEGTNGAHSADTTGDNAWGLVPDELPAMAFSPTSPGAIVRLDDIAAEQPGLKAFPEAGTTLPAAGHFHIMLDRKTLTTAYPMLTVSGGKGAKIMLTYAEALYDKERHKGDRDEVGNRTAIGITDRFLPDGGQHRTFEPLWWRTWRYLDLDIETAAEPLKLEGMTAEFTAYPFEERATFKSGRSDLDKIWEISWRTARLDAHETYMDTPYYEQLQYVGDTRIQALISYSVAGDDRLAKQALRAFDESRIPEGITRSRYPSSLPQSIPTFSLLYIGMLHDYWMYRPDVDFARTFVPGTRTILTWFHGYEQPDGLLKRLPWWSFIDWVSEGETPTYDSGGESCMTTLEYLGALTDAAELEKALGDPTLGERYAARAGHVREGLYEKCWSKTRGLIADAPDKKVFSQQANILGVLYDVIPNNEQQGVLRKMVAIDPGMTMGGKPDAVLSASYYFRFYLARALDHAGMADAYLDSLGPWRQLLPMHFSTWPEIPGNTRSDSHAWSAHPIYDLLTLVAGIEPASPGFKTVRIAPHPGDLPALTASYPHPQGKIEVEYRNVGTLKNPGVKAGTGFHARIVLPGNLTGTFALAGRSWPLKPGENLIDDPMK
jgi:alpha-L-rhamnosidase